MLRVTDNGIPPETDAEIISILVTGTPPLPSAPDQVTDLALTVISDTRVDLAWTIPAHNGTPITGYFIERDLSSTGFATIETSFGNAASATYSDMALTPGNTVTYRIRADNGNLPPALFSTAPTAVTTTMTDTDSDGILDFTDPDDDNDGVLDADEFTLLTDPLNPDSDHDGIFDSLDRNPMSDANLFPGCGSIDTILNMAVAGIATCAATNSVMTVIPAGVAPGGDLLIIAPTVILGPGFSVDGPGRLSVFSTDPAALIP